MASAQTNPFQEIFDRQRSLAIKLRAEHYKERINRLLALEKWIFANRRSIQEAVQKDFQKSPEEVDISEIYPVVHEIRKAKRQLRHWVRPKSISTPLTYLGSTAEVHYEPKGTALIISPWNYPFQLAVGPVVSAIAAGNTIILKPSEYTPQTSAVLAKMAEDLFCEEYMMVAEGDYLVAGQLLSLPFDHIFFTGSPKVGKIVMEAAAKHLTSVTLELGGKSPAIVDETADVADAAEKLAWGKWLNAGQTCVAPDYILCHETKIKALVSALEKNVRRIYGTPEVYTGIVSEQHLKRLTEALEKDKKAGAQIAFGNEVKEGKLLPTVITKLPPDSMFLEEEIFGPVLPVIGYADFSTVIKEINAQPKPLAMYHFSKDNQAMRSTKQQVSAGTMCFNDCVIQFVHPELPIGGVNNSGIGKAHGHFGFLAFSNEKAVLKQRRGWTMAKTLYPPYTGFKKLTLELLMKYL